MPLASGSKRGEAEQRLAPFQPRFNDAGSEQSGARSPMSYRPGEPGRSTAAWHRMGKFSFHFHLALADKRGVEELDVEGIRLGDY